MRRITYDDEIMKQVTFRIPAKYIDAVDKLSYKYADGNRTRMFIKMIDEYEIYTDKKKWRIK